MGTVPPQAQDEASCFRACLRQKKQQLPKRPAMPLSPNNRRQKATQPGRSQIKSEEHARRESLLSPKNITVSRTADSPGAERLGPPQSPANLGLDTDGSPPQQSPDKEKALQCDPFESEGVMLGLQSKFSSSRKGSIRKHGTFTRITAASERVGTNSNWEKEGAESDETNHKSQGISTDSGRSKKVLLGKIEEMKQKYFQRELQIEICQDENEYEANFGHSSDKDLSMSKKSIKQVSGEQPRKVESVRQKILDKINKRKLNKSKHKENTSTEKILETSTNQELQLYSKNQILEEPEPTLKESAKLKKSAPLDLSQSIRSARDTQDLSIEERIDFSGYTQQQTLHQIRECDEQEEDYKSKMTSLAKGSRSRGLPPRCPRGDASGASRVSGGQEKSGEAGARVFVF